MTKQEALDEAKKIANTNQMVMAVVKDPMSDEFEDDPDKCWNYCPNIARNKDGKLLLFPYPEEVILVNPD